MNILADLEASAVEQRAESVAQWCSDLVVLVHTSIQTNVYSTINIFRVFYS